MVVLGFSRRPVHFLHGRLLFLQIHTLSRPSQNRRKLSLPSLPLQQCCKRRARLAENWTDSIYLGTPKNLLASHRREQKRSW